MVVTTLAVPIAVTPELLMVKSPVTATAVASLDPFPIKISPSFNDDPIGETPVIVVELALVILPFASTTIVGTVVAVPKVPAVTPEVAKVVAKLPVPVPVTSPVKVIVWSPVFVPLTVASSETVSVFVSAIVSVAPVVGAVMATLFTESALAAPNTGLVKVGLVKVLLVNVSVPSKVAKVPVAPGKVIVVVPATAGAFKVAVPEVNPEKATLVADAVPKVGENKVGDVLNTNEPVPVLLVMALAKFTLDGVVKKEATLVPNPVMSAIPIVPQAGATAAKPVPVCVKNFLVADVFPDKNELVLAAD
jgi:hypothetical protein